MKYAVKEIFGPTIQGEGSYAGLPVMFIRFAGCNRWTGREEDRAKATCWFCDTDFYKGEQLTAADIIARLQDLEPVPNVVISGGEATLQLNAHLLQTLTDYGYKLHLETNGSTDISDFEHFFTHITMSPKQPPTKTKLKGANKVKILFPPPIADVTPAAFQSFNAKRLFLQPVDGPNLKQNTALAVQYCLRNPEWSLSVQLHKILEVK